MSPSTTIKDQTNANADMAANNWTQELLLKCHGWYKQKFNNESHSEQPPFTKLAPTLFPTYKSHKMLFLFLFLASHASPASTRSIFLLAGQSNMAGRGGVLNNTATGVAKWDGFVPPECRPNPSVLRLDAALQWVPAAEPLHWDIDYTKINGVGPGMAFADGVVARHPGIGEVGLVPCAVGGTSLSEWGRGSFLYKQLVRRAQAAAAGGGVIRALLWYQGETDALTREEAQVYKGKLVKFFLDLGDDLHLPMIPIIQVALAGQEAYIDTIRKAQLGIGLANVKTVDAKGLPLEMDGVHLTTLAQVRLGHMLSDAYLQSYSPFLPVSRQTSSASTSTSALLATSFLIFHYLAKLHFA